VSKFVGITYVVFDVAEYDTEYTSEAVRLARQDFGDLPGFEIRGVYNEDPDRGKEE
jgi:hypothetical protein